MYICNYTIAGLVGKNVIWQKVKGMSTINYQEMLRTNKLVTYLRTYVISVTHMIVYPYSQPYEPLKAHQVFYIFMVAKLIYIGL